MLKHVLRANAVSCALFGTIFMLATPATAGVIGNPPVLLLQILGIGLVANAALLIWSSTRKPPDRMHVLFFSLGDALWVAATVIVLLGGFWITTAPGVAWSVAVAFFVGTCGVLQWWHAPSR